MTENEVKIIPQEELADEMQMELYKKFPNGHFLSNQKNCDHFLRWNTFYRRNFHRFAMDVLKINLYPYQALALYQMCTKTMITIIASRAAAKSFLVALYSCIRCILYPGSLVVLCAGSKGQSELIVSEKIRTELMEWSPMLRREIQKIVINTNDIIVHFRSGSQIIVVAANENARGHRSNVAVRDEFRLIPESIDASVISPFQVLRQTPYASRDFYADKLEVKDEAVDVYISSSWLDNGNWMWRIVDNTYESMLKGKKSCLLAFDEAVTLRHGIKSMSQLMKEKRKIDSMTWDLEYLNIRLKENTAAFFTYAMLQQNQRTKMPFYPRTLQDFKAGKKNPYAMSKLKDEVRIIACDMAFVESKNNDNSIFSCMRLLPETTVYNSKDESGKSVEVDNGYRRIVAYMEHIQGGDVTRQAVRIRQLFEDFNADYIVLDTRNAGVAIYDLLAKIMYDEERGMEYTPLSCMNNDAMTNRIQIAGAKECIYAINASQNLNSTIAQDFRRVLESKKIDLLVPFETASEEVLPNIKEYQNSADADTQFFYESPFWETQALISETASLIYEKKEQTGVIVMHEQGSNRKDRYTSVSYGSYFATQLEKDLISSNSIYEFHTFVN